MKISAIDIGSNSVRLATVSDGKTLYKRLETTRLGEGLCFSGTLSGAAIERTAQAVAVFFSQAISEDADKVYAFATAAVRSSQNGAEFTARVKELCGLNVEVLSGETEARCGILGALRGKDGGIIDVGGASTEVTVSAGGKTLYTKRVNIGTVRLHDAAGRDRQKLLKAIEEKLPEYGDFKISSCHSERSEESLRVCAIGGTASRLAAVKLGATEYSPEITDGTILTLEDMHTLTDKLLTLPVETIRKTTICKNSADVVGGGSLLMLKVMQKFGLKQITVSESDNLEGYIMLKEGVL